MKLIRIRVSRTYRVATPAEAYSVLMNDNYADSRSEYKLVESLLAEDREKAYTVFRNRTLGYRSRCLIVRDAIKQKRLPRMWSIFAREADPVLERKLLRAIVKQEPLACLTERPHRRRRHKADYYWSIINLAQRHRDVLWLAARPYLNAVKAHKMLRVDICTNRRNEEEYEELRRAGYVRHPSSYDHRKLTQSQRDELLAIILASSSYECARSLLEEKETRPMYQLLGRSLTEEEVQGLGMVAVRGAVNETKKKYGLYYHATMATRMLKLGRCGHYALTAADKTTLSGAVEAAAQKNIKLEDETAR